MTLGEFLVDLGAEYPVSDDPNDLLLEVVVNDDFKQLVITGVEFDYASQRVILHTEPVE